MRSADRFHPWRPHVAFAFLFLGALAAYVADNALPTPRAAKTTPASEFSEERARQHLQRILSFGIRTVGSYANEVSTPQYIADFARQLRSPQSDKDIEVDVQHPSGSFSSWFLGGFTNVYHNVTNVVVRVSGNQHPRTKQNALLVSAHFDTALGTVAAGDDAAMIAAMMEILSNLAHQDDPLDHAVIFNFNGAEETNWQAAHGFITQHPWADTIRSVINLEGAGSGGRAMVVQTGPKHSWIASTFGKAAARPHAYTMAQEIFQAKVIPGWTDFETYIEFSDHEIAGLDMVFIKNGYVYHTAQDDLAHVTAGTLQHVGNNLLPTVRAMANSPYLVDSLAFRDRSAVFFDVWGLFLIVISDADVARGFYLCFAALVLLLDFRDAAASNSSYRSWIVSISRALAFQTLVFFGGILASLFIGVLFAVFTSHSMAWYAHFNITCLLFGMSSLAGVLSSRMLCIGILPQELK
eukprot:g422.t1